MNTRHIDRTQYFKEQNFTTEKHVIPYLTEFFELSPGLTVLEIGCGEGGNLKPFLDRGCRVIGIDLAANKISNAETFFKDHPHRENLTLITADIFNVQSDGKVRADLILMRDTLEHIHDQDFFLEHLKNFLAPKARVFLAFPPWFMPFGGHQQMCENSFLSKLPYFHLFPKTMYTLILKLFGENNHKIDALLEIKETRISIIRFKKILKKRNYRVEKETFYMINPNYEIKFNLKKRKLPPVLNVPFVRDFFTTTYYTIISLKENS